MGQDRVVMGPCGGLFCLCVYVKGGVWIMRNRPFPWIPAPLPATRTPRTSTPPTPADTWDFFLFPSLFLPLFPSGTCDLPPFKRSPLFLLYFVFLIIFFLLLILLLAAVTSPHLSPRLLPSLLLNSPLLTSSPLFPSSTLRSSPFLSTHFLLSSLPLLFSSQVLKLKTDCILSFHPLSPFPHTLFTIFSVPCGAGPKALIPSSMPQTLPLCPPKTHTYTYAHPVATGPRAAPVCLPPSVFHSFIPSLLSPPLSTSHTLFDSQDLFSKFRVEHTFLHYSHLGE